MWDYMANIYISTPLWEYKQPFRHRALLLWVGMEKQIKTKGMIHIKGVNDKEYAEFINKQKPVVKNNLWYQLP